MIETILRNWGYENPVLVGKGAFSHVYRVKDCLTGQFVACKISEEKQMLWRESQILQGIDHPLFPKFFGIKKLGERSFLFMEYVHGSSLEAFIEKRGRISQQQVVRIGIALAEGLCYLQERTNPIVFRDIKPENIMLREDGQVKLVDLGSAGEMEIAGHVITGTKGFSAPEQWNIDGKIGCYSDVYAVGRVMKMMLEKTQKKIGKRGIEHLIEECIRIDVRERIPNMRCLLNRLRPYEKRQMWKVLCLEAKAYLGKRHGGEYVFLHNVMKNTNHFDEKM